MVPKMFLFNDFCLPEIKYDNLSLSLFSIHQQIIKNKKLYQAKLFIRYYCSRSELVASSSGDPIVVAGDSCEYGWCWLASTTGCAVQKTQRTDQREWAEFIDDKRCTSVAVARTLARI